VKVDLAEVMFWFSSIWIMPFWVLMWFLPNHDLTRRFVGDLRFCFIPLLVPYIVLVLPQVGSIFLTFASEMPTPEIVVDLFADPEVIMLGWLHFLAFDMFLGRFIWLRMVAAQRPLYISAPILILCTMVAPLGCGLGIAATWNKDGPIDSASSSDATALQ
jgi:hypothetical protein